LKIDRPDLVFEEEPEVGDLNERPQEADNIIVRVVDFCNLIARGNQTGVGTRKEEEV
jgi:hypothetical protein